MATGDLLVIGLGLAALFATWMRGPRWAVEMIYVPALLLIPTQPVLNLSGVPDLNPQRAIAASILFAVLASGDLRKILPRRWRLVDYLALAPVLSFSISYAVAEDASGFFNPKAFMNRIPMLLLEWGCPYLFVRALITDRTHLARLLTPIVYSTCALALLAAVECRLAVRFTVNLWNAIGLGLPVPPHWGDWRLGMLRAFTHFLGPITLGTVFVSLVPLTFACRYVRPRMRGWSLLASVAAIVGVCCCLSRGPALVLVLLALVVPVYLYRMRMIALLMGLVVLFAVPTIYVVAGDAIAYTIERVEATGNTAGESGYYRIALLIIYGKQIAGVGFWGDPDLIGAGRFAGANSIDNAYLYLFLVGGWIGGGLVLLINLFMLHRVWRVCHPLNGAARRFGVALATAFAAVAICMANVWFADDYASWYWLLVGLMANLPLLVTPAAAPQGTRPPVRVAGAGYSPWYSNAPMS